MKGFAILRQFLIIVTVSFVGEALNRLIPLPIPGSIYGLVLMLLCLMFHVFPLSAVKDVSNFFIEIMPVFFVPPGVCVLESLDVLKAKGFKILLITFVTTVCVMVVSGKVTELVIKLTSKGEEHGDA